MRAKKSLGQNFLTSRGVARDIVAAAQIAPDDVVLEIGPGKGFLTEGLLQKAGKVIAVEKDVRMISYLKDKFAQEIRNGKLELVHGDILTLNPTNYKLKTNTYKLVANIPYYITGEILRTFLSGDLQPQRMVLMVQKEVADRIVARPRHSGARDGKPFDPVRLGSFDKTQDKSPQAAQGKESILSMSVKAYGTPRYIQKVPARYFSPEPNVDSAVLLIENISKNNFAGEQDENAFFELMKRGFAHKRKMLWGNLKNFYEPKKLGEGFEKCDIASTVRAENLSLNQWFCLGEALMTRS
ncbi:MAG: rRNA adenine dimethyltransferase family protein [bacterium]|nr:rRNA adenine dimethyltransferase family protein [bacterium]